MAIIGRAILTIAADVSKVVSGVNTVNHNLKRIDKTLNRTRENINNYIKSFLGFYVASKAIDATIDSIKSLISTSAQFEQYNTVLTNLFGDATKAKEATEWITKFTANTPYELSQVTESFVKLKAYGLEPTKGLLKTLGDTSSAMGKPLMQAVEAIADAVTGENERLKEFGVKASLQGNKVAYSWTDASGKAKHIVIENNKEIIQSTLEAIFNSKYAGAMQMQSKTWNGLISNIKDNWTIFKKDIMDAGLFNYLKSIVIVVGDYLKRAYGSAKEGARDFTINAISFIKSTLTGVGNLIDIWNIFKLGLNTLQVVFGKLMEFTAKGLQSFSNAAAKAYNFIMQGWVKFTNFLGRGWTNIINFFIKGWNKFINGISGAWNAVASKLHLPTIKPAIVDLKEFKAQTIDTIAVAKDFSKELGFWKQYTAENKQEMLEYYGKVATGAGSSFAERFIKAVDATYNKIKSSKILPIADKKKYEEQLKKLGAKDGAFKSFEKATKKAGHSAKKAHKDAAKAAKAHRKELERLAKEAEKVKLRYSDIFKNSLESLLNGDFKSSFENLFAGLGNKLLEPMMNNVSNYLSKAFNNFASGLSGLESGLMGFGLSLIPNILSNLFSSTVSEAEIKAAEGRVKFDDDSLNKLSTILENTNNPLLPYTRQMRDYLNSINKNFINLGKALGSSANFDYSGLNYIPTQKSVLGGLYSKQTALIGSGLALNDINLSDASFSAYTYKTEKVHKTYLWSLFSSTKIKEVRQSLNSATANAFREILKAGTDAIVDSSKILGYDVKDAIKRIKISLGKINLKGLSKSEIQDRLERAFSEVFSTAIGKLKGINKLVDRYKKTGEEHLETLARIGVSYEQASDMLKKIGFDVNDVYGYKKQFEFNLFTFGKNIASVFKNGVKHIFDGMYKDAYTVIYSSQQKVLDIVDASGGLDKFTSAYNMFLDNFYTDADKLSMYRRTLKEQFSTLHITMPRTKEDFRKLIENFKVFDKTSAKTFADLLKLNDAFSKYSELEKKLQEERINKEKDHLNKLLDFNKQILGQIEDFWTGSLSYLSTEQKIAKLEELKNFYKAKDSSKYFEVGRKQLELYKQRSTTVEEYRQKADLYIYNLTKAKPDTTLKDVVKSIEELKAENAKIREEIAKTAKTQIETDNKLTNTLIEQNKKIERAIEASNYKV